MNLEKTLFFIPLSWKRLVHERKTWYNSAIEAARIRRPCLLCKNEKEVTSLEFLQTIT